MQRYHPTPTRSRLPLGCLAALLAGLALAGTAPAQDKEAIDEAVRKGVLHLRKLQGPDGRWPYTDIGATALAALALLECGVEPEDPALVRAADIIRQSSVQLDHTYSIALTILFLDRLGDPLDVPLIESLTVRLLGGQLGDGGWSYQCPAIPADEARRLNDVLRRRSELVGRRELPKARPGEPRPRRTVEDLPEEIRKQLGNLNRVVGGVQNFAGSDNSNTQFATFGLWVARRHGLPVERALKALDARMRGSQNPDGGWPYRDRMPSTAAMTCAGLLGLAVAHGVVAEEKGDKAPNPAADPAIRAGLVALGSCIDHPTSRKGKGARVPIINYQAGPPGPGGPAAMLARMRNPELGRSYYFLFSLERTALAYGLKTIGDKDWYAWGAEILVANQRPDGSWVGEYARYGADTAFALLFLRRANLAQDLTAKLTGRVRDPGQAQLRAGGVGGAGLVKKEGLKPVFGGGGTPAAVPDTPAPRGGGDDTPALLAKALARAAGAEQDRLIDQLRQGKGVAYTDALADAIPTLSGEARRKARDALAERLSRMTSAVLRDKLEDRDAEVRRAAALACAMREDTSHLARLIDLLEKDEPTVARAAYAALRVLSGEDYGPPLSATRDEQARAVAAWRAWLRKQEGK